MPSAKYLFKEIDLSEYNLGTITPLTVKEVVELDEKKETKINEDVTKFGLFLMPFVIEDQINISEVFNPLFFETNQDNQVFLISLADSLKILYRTKDVKIELDSNNNFEIIVSKIIKINKDNVLKLCEIVREMFFIEKTNKEENRVIQVAEENKAILEEYLRLKQQHEKEMEEINKKNKKSLHQIITAVASQCMWDYDKVLDMTYYRLINTYMSIFKIDNYKIYMQYATSGHFDMKNHKQDYWMDVVGK